MPIYEYRCNACRRKVSVFQRSISAQAAPVCSHCGGADLTRLLSRFAVVRSEDDMLDSMDASILDGVDESDPRSVAAWAKKMSRQMGEDLGPEFDDMVERMEAGEMPDDMEDPDGGDVFAGEE